MLNKSKYSDQIARRKFLHDAGLFALGTTLVPSRFFSEDTYNAPEPGKIALQLYTVREQVKENIADTLHKIAAIGFENVETAFWPDTISVKQAGKYLKDAGLKEKYDLRYRNVYYGDGK